MKRVSFFMLALLLPIIASAGNIVEVDGIYYNLVDKSKEAEVTVNPKGNYTMTIEIPAYITYGGETYRVYSIGSDAFANCRNLFSVTIPNTSIAL